MPAASLVGVEGAAPAFSASVEALVRSSLHIMHNICVVVNIRVVLAQIDPGLRTGPPYEARDSRCRLGCSTRVQENAGGGKLQVGRFHS